MKVGESLKGDAWTGIRGQGIMKPAIWSSQSMAYESMGYRF
jgi:hypothetical protein